MGLAVRVQNNPNTSEGGVVLTLQRRTHRRANRPRQTVYSNGGYAKLYKGFYATEEEALRTSRVRAFRHYVTYLMDKRFTLVTKPNAPLEASPAPTPHTSPAKRGRPCKRVRPTMPPNPEPQEATATVDEELTTAQECLSKQMARLRKALVLNGDRGPSRSARVRGQLR